MTNKDLILLENAYVKVLEEAKKKVEKSPEAIVERKGLMAKGVA